MIILGIISLFIAFAATTVSLVVFLNAAVEEQRELFARKAQLEEKAFSLHEYVSGYIQKQTLNPDVFVFAASERDAADAAIKELEQLTVPSRDLVVATGQAYWTSAAVSMFSGVIAARRAPVRFKLR